MSASSGCHRSPLGCARSADQRSQAASSSGTLPTAKKCPDLEPCCSLISADVAEVPGQQREAARGRARQRLGDAGRAALRTFGRCAIDAPLAHGETAVGLAEPGCQPRLVEAARRVPAPAHDDPVVRPREALAPSASAIPRRASVRTHASSRESPPRRSEEGAVDVERISSRFAFSPHLGCRWSSARFS